MSSTANKSQVGKAAPDDPEDFREDIKGVASNRTEDEEYYISAGSANFMSWLGITLMIPGIIMLLIPSAFNLWGGIGFTVLGAYVTWTGVGAVKLFK